MHDQIRYDGVVEDGVLVLEGEYERLEVGPVDAIVELVGGETYTVQYDPRQRAVSWLSTDEDGTVTFDVRDALTDWAYTETFVANVRASPLEATDGDGDGDEYPVRTAVFAELLTTIWDEKGDLTT